MGKKQAICIGCGFSSSFFLPGVGVIGGIVWPPILIAGIFLLGIWINNLRKMPQARKRAVLNEEVVYQEEVACLLENVKRHLQVEALTQASIGLKESALHQEMKEIMHKQREMLFVGAILNGFIGGFLKYPLFLGSFLQSLA